MDRNLKIYEINSTLAQIFRWVNDGVSQDSSRPNLNVIQVKAPHVQSTNGFTATRATFDSLERLGKIIPDGFYRLEAVRPKFMVVEEMNIDKPFDIDAIWISRDRIWSEEMTDVIGGAKSIQASIAFSPELLKHSTKLMRCATIAFSSAHSPIWIGGTSIDTYGYGLVIPEAILMPMVSGEYPTGIEVRQSEAVPE